jgi:hypothetical protein
MSRRLCFSVEMIFRLPTVARASTVVSIAGLCAAPACPDDQVPPAAREAVGSRLGDALPVEKLGGLNS